MRGAACSLTPGRSPAGPGEDNKTHLDFARTTTGRLSQRAPLHLRRNFLALATNNEGVGARARALETLVEGPEGNININNRLHRPTSAHRKLATNTLIGTFSPSAVAKSDKNLIANTGHAR